MDSLEQIKDGLLKAVPGALVEILPNGAPGNEPSLCVDPAHARAAALYLRDDPGLCLDYCSNVTGVDWLDTVIKEKVKVRKLVEGQEKEVEETVETARTGYLEAVYHLYSVPLRHGPLVLRVRASGRTDPVHLPSLTPVWRSAEFQEREIYDLYGIRFDGHPDLRRILMWDGFEDHPMRKDYVEPDDYEYEPTPHDDVLTKAQQRGGSG